MDMKFFMSFIFDCYEASKREGRKEEKRKRFKKVSFRDVKKDENILLIRKVCLGECKLVSY